MRNVTKTLKTLMLFAVSMFVFVTFGFAQQTMLLTESFETGNGATPPAGWELEQVTGTTLGVTFVTSSTLPTISAAYDGTKFVRYNSYNISSGSTRLKRTVAMSTTNKAFIMVDFAWYEDPGYPTSADKVDVQWSTDGIAWNTAGTFNRYNAVAGWKGKNVVLPAGANNQATIYVAFLFTSAYGNNCAMDLVHVTAGPPPPPAFVTIGTGTTAVGWPYYTFYMGSRTQMIYTAAQLTAGGAPAGNFTSIGFDIASAASQTMTNFTVKMGNTAVSTFTAYLTGLTTVYQTNYSVPGTGWRDITLTTPFVWDGTSNVVVEICFGDNGFYTSNSTVRGTAITGRTRHNHADNYAGCTGTNAGANQTTTPNIRFGVPPVSPGVLMGYVRDVNTLAPIAGAIVQVGTARDTSRANGMYIIYNLNAGPVTANCTAAGYISGSASATIVTGAVTNLDILMAPGPKVGGIVTDASTGAPITGAFITVGTGPNAITTLSIAGGSYLSPLLSIQGPQPIVIGKTGYDDFTATVNLVPNTTASQDASLLPTAVQPGPFTAVLNNPVTPTSVNLNWGVPQGFYQLIYDDGTQDNFAIWANANNLNALKFTPLSWPVKLIGGKVNLGAAANYPSNALPLTKFWMFAYKADGPGGVPGTVIDSVEVTPAGFGWADYSFAAPISINSGDFYLVMRQGGIPPHAAGVGVDLTNTQLRSYSKFVTGGGPWVPAAGNFMIRAIVQGTGGPMLSDNQSSDKELITASAVNGLIYESPVTTVTGYEGVARTEPFEWTTMQNTNVAPQITVPVTAMQPATDEGVGSNIVGTIIPTDAPAALLYDNGPMITSTGTGFGGADESMLQAPLSSYGTNINHAVYYRIADDFTVTGNPWTVTSLEFYGYQTGSPITSSFTAAYCRILNGNPSVPGSTVVWGDTTTNRLSSTSFTNIYRVSVTGNNQRPIMKIVINTSGLSLPAGNYWIEFAALGSIASGPWCPYVTISGTPTTGNGLLYTGTVGGYVPINATYGQGVPFKITGTQSTTSSMTYQVWRLKQGQEGNQTLWTSIGTPTVNSMVDNSWPTLACGPYRWAVKAIYSPPGQRPSAPTFSNVLGKCWIANVNVCVTLTCAANPKAGTTVKLINADYPDTNYTKVSDTSGCVSFSNVWKGNYNLEVTRFSYPVYTQSVTIMGDATFNVTLLQDALPATNLTVNDQSLHAQWNPPRALLYQLEETFASGSFATNQWVISGGTNWQMSTGIGNPAPAARFSWTPQQTNYDQYLTSKSVAGVHAPQMKLKYDMMLDNYGTTNLNTLAVELWNGTSWTVLKTYNNQTPGNIPWTSETLDITSVTNNTDIKVRFHAAGVNSVDIDYWYVDNVRILSTDGTTGPNPCVIGYNFYLNNVLSAFTPDTNYNIPPNQVVYGQNYQACVKAVYGSGYSPQICVNFTAHFLYPARDLTATDIECNAYLTWLKPQTMTDAPQILSINQQPVDPNSITDRSPFAIEMSKTAPIDNGDAMWDLMFAWPTTTNQEVAVVCIGDFIFTCRWAGGPTWYYKYNKTTGVQVETFDISGLSAVRDFAWDGTNAYGTGYTSTIHKLDLPGHAIVSSLTTSAGNIRHIAYDPVNNGFWVGDWTTMMLVSATTGSVIATAPAVVNVYGSAYDNDPAGPFLWVHSQTSSGLDIEIQQYKITGTTLTNTGVTFDPSTLPGAPPGALAGGLETIEHAGKFGLLGNSQNLNWVFALELRTGGGGGGGTPVGLIGYNIYRDDAFIHYNPHPDSITYYDYNLDPGTYDYEVKAKYDLTTYGFPGQFGESLGNTAGEKTVTLNCGAPLPFLEEWTLGTFAFQNWAPTGHWSMNTGIGNPAPSADFTWQPAIANYSQPLTSEIIDASPWNCATIWLDFDLKLIDQNNTGDEKLTVDIFYNGSWHQKLEVTNNGSTNWVPKHLDISAVKGKAFRIRFVANGVNSGDMLHWYVDNIHAYGICTPATAVTATQSQFTTTLTWVAPECVGTIPTVLVKLFQWSGTPDNGYYQNYNMAYGVVYDLSAYPDAAANKIDFHHASWGVTGIWQYNIHVVDWTTFTELAMVGPISTTGDDKWENDVLLGNVAGVGGKMLGIMLEPLSNSPTDAYPCFSADNVGPDGVSVFGTLPDYSSFGPSGIGDFLQNLWIEIPADDKMELVQPRKVYVNELQALANTRTASSVQNTPAYLFTNQTGIANSNIDADSSVLMGYNVYRTDETGVGPYTKLNASPVTALTYVDTYPSTLIAGTFKYYVTSLYNNSEDNTPLCESSSDTVSVTFPATSVNELTSGQIMIYPNPANEVVNIKSDYTITAVDVMNYVGQTVYTNRNVDSKTAKLNVTTFKVGVYFVKVSTLEGIRTVKITVTH